MNSFRIFLLPPNPTFIFSPKKIIFALVKKIRNVFFEIFQSFSNSNNIFNGKKISKTWGGKGGVEFVYIVFEVCYLNIKKLIIY
jgi:hypothetical protein